MLTIHHASKSFGATRAVDDVSLTIASGEIVGLVGENGAGKTTLMRIVAGELAANSGTIDKSSRIGFVHQHFMLVNDFSIAENLALATGARPRDAPSIIEASGIDLGDVTRRARDLAVGEKSKLELIKAIARKPELLILDEPTSVLTPYESDELFRVMRRIAAEGTAVVFISHKVREVVEVATRVVVMRRGRVVVESSKMSADELASAMIESPRGDFAPATCDGPSARIEYSSISRGVRRTASRQSPAMSATFSATVISSTRPSRVRSSGMKPSDVRGCS